MEEPTSVVPDGVPRRWAESAPEINARCTNEIVSLFAFLTMAPLLIGEANAQGVAAFDLMPSRDLGVLPGFESGAAAVAINPSGQVVGYSFKYLGELDTHRYHAFFWTEPDGMLDLGTLGGDDSWATDLNAKGQVVGFSTVAPRVFRAFSWTAAGGMVDLWHSAGWHS